VNALAAMEQLAPVISARAGAPARQLFYIVKIGSNRLVLRGGPKDAAAQEAVVELFDMSGRKLMAAHVKAGGSISVPGKARAATGCIVARVRWQGGMSFAELFSSM
jgi:hypothetical protein